MEIDRYKIIVRRYSRYWAEEEETIFTGMSKDQMLNLFDRLKNMQGPKTLSIRLEGEGATIEQKDF